MSDSPLQITMEFTPNPNTLKFVVNKELLKQGTASFDSVGETEQAPLPKELFQVEGVQAILIGSNFITITKDPESYWDDITEQIPKRIQGFLKTGNPILDPQWSGNISEPGNGSEIELKIRQILDNEIRPAVARDGGDIVFHKFENGIVYLHLQGACRSCPGALATLKVGVEARLKEVIPEVKEVAQVT